MRKVAPAPILVVVALLVGAAEAARGQQISSPYNFIEGKQDLGLTLSWLLADAGSAGLGPQDGLAFGVEYTRRVSRPLSLTPTLLWFSSERNVIDPSLAEGESGSLPVGTADIDLLLIGGRVNFNVTGTRTWHRLAPYVVGGLGIAVELGGDPGCLGGSSHPDCQIEPRERFDFGSSFLLQAGIGTVWLPGQGLGARLELVNLIWRLKTPPGYYDAGVTLDPVPQFTDWTNNLQLNLGLSYWF